MSVTKRREEESVRTKITEECESVGVKQITQI